MAMPFFFKCCNLLWLLHTNFIYGGVFNNFIYSYNLLFFKNAVYIIRMQMQ